MTRMPMKASIKISPWGRLLVVACILLAATGCASSAQSDGSSAPAAKLATTSGHHHHAVVHHKRAARQKHRRHHSTVIVATHPAGVPAVDLPNPALTPGAVLTTSTARVCASGYSASVRNVPSSENSAVYARYGIPHVPYQHEVDHLVSLEVGGSNAITNLWPEPYAGRWGARTKDVLENTLHELICSGRLSLPYAQHIEATHWITAYKRYVGATPSAPTGSGSGGGGGVSAGGYYASSYGTASTIYCADDSEWQSLSKTYLVHFPTWTKAITRFPGYHLHQPC
jgi:hypothetical protein